MANQFKKKKINNFKEREFHPLGIKDMISTLKLEYFEKPHQP